jgi:hypothetical protein
VKTGKKTFVQLLKNNSGVDAKSFFDAIVHTSKPSK